MKKSFRHLVQTLSCVAAAALVVAALQAPAQADTAPPDPNDPTTPVTVAADPLPTVQIDGVAWTQRVIGNTVYVGGDFANSRPAGAAPGTNLTPRANLLAYDITTGNLISSWAPTTDGDVLSIVPSPDKTVLYIGGSFTHVNGQIRDRIAAIDPSTGKLVNTFQPKPDATVRAIVATNSTVYFGGLFSSVNNVTRPRVAAAQVSDGALLSWAPNAQGGSVHSLALSPTGDRLIIGGSFTSMNGSGIPAYGLAAVNPATGASLPFPANAQVRDAGPNSAITGLSSDGDSLYASGFVYGGGGNLEGIARINWADLTVVWIEDCHGDTYGTYPKGDVIYASSHAHYCGNLPDGFTQTSPTWTMHYGTAFTKAITGKLTADTLNYFNWQGNNSPSLLKWFPLLLNGTFTGQGQAGWNVTGNDHFVTIGGEFPTAGGIPQQGLVRYADKDSGPNKIGPVFDQSHFNPTLSSYASGTVRVSWRANWDRDNEQLTYQVLRNSVPVYTTTALSSEWSRPDMGFLDTGLVPGQTYRYRVFAQDPFGNVVRSDTVTIVASGSGTLSAYARDVLNDGVSNYWRLDESSGTTLVDSAGVTNGTVQSGVTRGVSGALIADPDTATSFNGSSSGYGSGNVVQSAPHTFTAEAWFKTTTSSGGRIVGFGSNQTGTSSSSDRHVYMNNAGQLYFGAYNDAVKTLSTTRSYNDGAWHQVVASLGPAGMSLSVDGAFVNSRSDVIKSKPYEGYWRVGGDNLSGWTSRPSSDYFNGAIDEVAIYPNVLTAAQIAKHYADGAVANVSPSASFTFDATTSTVAFDASASSDPDGTITSYAWDFGDGTTGTQKTTSHPYAVAGSYQVKLTVTDDDGATGTVTKTVNTVAPTGPMASDDFARTVTGGWGNAPTGGTWTGSGPASAFSVAGGTGQINLTTPGAGPRMALNSVNSVSTDVTVTTSLSKIANGGGVYFSVGGRTIGTNDYRAKVKVASNGGLTLYLTRVIANAETTLVSVVLPASANYTVGSSLQVRLQVQGTGTTALRAKVWKTGTTEPATWQLISTDSTAGLQAAGGVGLVTYLTSTVTNGPVAVSFDNLLAQPVN